MQQPVPDTPLAGAELAIEAAAIAALHRKATARTISAWLLALDRIHSLASGRPSGGAALPAGVDVELIRLAGLAAVRAAAADDDMHAMRVELAATLHELGAV